MLAFDLEIMVTIAKFTIRGGITHFKNRSMFISKHSNLMKNKVIRWTVNVAYSQNRFLQEFVGVYI